MASTAKVPSKRFVCNLNELVPTIGTSPLTILSDAADNTSSHIQSTLTSDKFAQAKHKFFTRDFAAEATVAPTTLTKSELAEYSPEELKNFAQIETRVKEIAARYNKTEEEIEQLFLQCSCNWDKVEGKFKAEGLKEWTQDEDMMIQKLVQGKGHKEVLERLARMTKPDYNY